MTIAVVQPYFFPYIGYFQLINAVDVFVFYDDVNFIKRGWINRNKILVNEQSHLISLPCQGASQNKLINEVRVDLDEKTRNKLLTKFEMAYKKAPYFEGVFPLVDKVLDANEKYVASLAMHSIQEVANYIGLQATFKVSSKEYNNCELGKAERLIDICSREGTDVYINPQGGRQLYTKAEFAKRNIDLRFLNPEPPAYKQFGNSFIPFLSIVDVLMFNSKEEVRNMLTKYHLE